MGSEMETLKKEYGLQSERVGMLLFLDAIFHCYIAEIKNSEKRMFELHQEAELLRTKFEDGKRRSQDGRSDNSGKD